MRNDVRELRIAKKLSQGELGEILDVSRQTVNAIETGRYVVCVLILNRRS